MNRVKELRELKGMNQLGLSTELGVTQATVCDYERGRSRPSVRVLLKMSKLFNASCDYILGLSDVKTIQSGGEYNEKEITLISQYRILAPSERKLTQAYIQGMIDRKADS